VVSERSRLAIHNQASRPMVATAPARASNAATRSPPGPPARPGQPALEASTPPRRPRPPMCRPPSWSTG
jgi:hypothetical protein